MTEHKSSGKVGNDEVEFVYLTSSPAGENVLRYTPLNGGAATGATNIYSSNIVAVFDAHTDTEHDHLLVSVRESAISKDVQASLALSFLRTSGLPGQFVQDFGSALDYVHEHEPVPGRERQLDVGFEFMISTASGSRIADRFFSSTLRPLLKALDIREGDEYQVYHTSSEHSITTHTKLEVLPPADAGYPHNIVLLSGDGGVIDIVDTLHACARTSNYVRPKIYILPFGTGNALSNTYNYTRDNTMGLSTLFRGKPRQLPTFRVTFSSEARLLVNEGNNEREIPLHNDQPTMWGAVVCSWGLHASLVADSDTTHYRSFGQQRFQMAAKELLSPEDGTGHHAYRGRVSVRQQESDEWTSIERNEHSYILATLVSNLEKTFTVSPDSKALDGKMRLVEMPAMSGDDLMKLMQDGYNGGQHVKDSKVGYSVIEGLKIEFDEDDARWRRVCVDGKIIRMGKGGSITVVKEPDSVVDIMCLE